MQGKRNGLRAYSASALAAYDIDNLHADIAGMTSDSTQPGLNGGIAGQIEATFFGYMGISLQGNIGRC